MSPAHKEKYGSFSTIFKAGRVETFYVVLLSHALTPPHSSLPFKMKILYFYLNPKTFLKKIGIYCQLFIKSFAVRFQKKCKNGLTFKYFHENVVEVQKTFQLLRNIA